MEHVVEPLILTAALHCHHVLWIGNHTDKPLIPSGAGADGAGAVALIKVLTDRTAVNGGFGAYYGVGKCGGVLLGQGEDKESQPLGALCADAGQAGELIICSMTGLSKSGVMGLGRPREMGRSRVPSPPARMTAFTVGNPVLCKEIS